MDLLTLRNSFDDSFGNIMNHNVFDSNVSDSNILDNKIYIPLYVNFSVFT